MSSPTSNHEALPRPPFYSSPLAPPRVHTWRPAPASPAAPSSSSLIPSSRPRPNRLVLPHRRPVRHFPVPGLPLRRALRPSLSRRFDVRPRADAGSAPLPSRQCCPQRCGRLFLLCHRQHGAHRAPARRPHASSPIQRWREIEAIRLATLRLAVTPTPRHPRLTPTPARRATLPRAAAGSLLLHRGGEHSEPASTQAASVICSSARGCACGASQRSVSGTLLLPRRSLQVESACRYRGIGLSNVVRMRPTSARSAKHDGTSSNNGRAMMDGDAGWWR
jgi:hypothetical protein